MKTSRSGLSEFGNFGKGSGLSGEATENRIIWKLSNQVEFRTRSVSFLLPVAYFIPRMIDSSYSEIEYLRFQQLPSNVSEWTVQGGFQLQVRMNQSVCIF